MVYTINLYLITRMDQDDNYDASDEGSCRLSSQTMQRCSSGEPEDIPRQPTHSGEEAMMPFVGLDRYVITNGHVF